MYDFEFFDRFPCVADVQVCGQAINVGNVIEKLAEIAGLSRARYFDVVNEIIRERVNGGQTLEFRTVLTCASKRLENNPLAQLKTAMPVLQMPTTALSERLKTRYGYTDEQIEAFFSLVSNDMDSDEETVSLTTRPFLKHEGVLWWFAPWLASMDLAVGLHTTLCDLYAVGNPKELADAAEEKLECLFSSAGFVTKRGYKYDGGEIDVLAFDPMENTLFVIEHKESIYVRFTVGQIRDHLSRRVEPGIAQLNRALLHIEASIDSIREALGVDIQQEGLRVFPILTSNSFEGDGPRKDTIWKISTFELSIILRNHKRFLVVMSDLVFRSLPNQDFDDVDEEEFGKNLHQQMSDTMENFNLWKGEKCVASDVIQAIEDRKVWKDLEVIPTVSEVCDLCVGGYTVVVDSSEKGGAN